MDDQGSLKLQNQTPSKWQGSTEQASPVSKSAPKSKDTAKQRKFNRDRRICKKIIKKLNNLIENEMIEKAISKRDSDKAVYQLNRINKQSRQAHKKIGTKKIKGNSYEKCCERIINSRKLARYVSLLRNSQDEEIKRVLSEKLCGKLEESVNFEEEKCQDGISFLPNEGSNFDWDLFQSKTTVWSSIAMVPNPMMLLANLNTSIDLFDWMCNEQIRQGIHQQQVDQNEGENLHSVQDLDGRSQINSIYQKIPSILSQVSKASNVDSPPKLSSIPGGFNSGLLAAKVRIYQAKHQKQVSQNSLIYLNQNQAGLDHPALRRQKSQ